MFGFKKAKKIKKATQPSPYLALLASGKQPTFATAFVAAYGGAA